jgi:hypothetical protein
MFNRKMTVQEILSLAYLYLLAMGILSDALYYGILGVSYLNFTTILDALISPVSMITDNYLITLTLVIMFGLMYLYITKLMPYMHQKNRERNWYKKITNIEKADKRMMEIKDRNNIYKVMGLMFFIMFVSLRIGMGMGTKMRITGKKAFNSDYTLVFQDGKTEEVRKIGQNSVYFFYVREREPVVVATPILDNIKEIKRIKKLK